MRLTEARRRILERLETGPVEDVSVDWRSGNRLVRDRLMVLSAADWCYRITDAGRAALADARRPGPGQSARQ